VLTYLVGLQWVAGSAAGAREAAGDGQSEEGTWEEAGEGGTGTTYVQQVFASTPCLVLGVTVLWHWVVRLSEC